MNDLKKSWRWQDDGKGGGKGSSPPSEASGENPSSEKPLNAKARRQDSRAESAKSQLREAKEAVDASIREASPPTVKQALTKLVKVDAEKSLHNKETSSNNYQYDEYIEGEESYTPPPPDIKQRLRKFDRNDWWETHYDFGNKLTSEELTGKYKHLFANAFYGLIERIGKETAKDESFRYSEHTKYNMNYVLGRRVTKKPLSKCKSYLERELVVLWLDTSGSCEGFSALLNMVASVARKRHDVLVIKTADCIMEHRKINNKDCYTFPLKKADSDALVKQGYGKYLVGPYGYPEADGKDSYDRWNVQILHGQKLICLSDSDSYQHFFYAMPSVGVVPEHFYFFDLYNYNRHGIVNADISNCRSDPSGLYSQIRNCVQEYHGTIGKRTELRTDNFTIKQFRDPDRGQQRWAVSTPWKASGCYTHLLTSDAAHLFELIKTLK